MDSKVILDEQNNRLSITLRNFHVVYADHSRMALARRIGKMEDENQQHT